MAYWWDILGEHFQDGGWRPLSFLLGLSNHITLLKYTGRCSLISFLQGSTRTSGWCKLIMEYILGFFKMHGTLKYGWFLTVFFLNKTWHPFMQYIEVNLSRTLIRALVNTSHSHYQLFFGEITFVPFQFLNSNNFHLFSSHFFQTFPLSHALLSLTDTHKFSPSVCHPVSPFKRCTGICWGLIKTQIVSATVFIFSRYQTFRRGPWKQCMMLAPSHNASLQQIP